MYDLYKKITVAKKMYEQVNQSVSITLALLQVASMTWTLNGKHKRMVT